MKRHLFLLFLFCIIHTNKNDSMSPLFSIITVTYNARSTVGVTMRSVAEQTFCDYEHIIVDGNSKDGTVDTVKNNSTERTKLISEPDKGLYDAMNKGIGLSHGKYLIFLNAGDSFHSSDTLDHIARKAKENDFPGILYGQTQLVDINRKRLGDRHLTAPENLTYGSFADGMVVCHQAFVVLSCIAPLYNLNYKFSADYDWCIQCLQHSRNNVYVPEITIDYLSEGLTTANHRSSLIERFRIMSLYYGTTRTLIRHLGFIPRFFAHKRKMKSAKSKIAEE